MLNTTYTRPAQAPRADLLPDDTELPPDFDRLKYPILARHFFGLVPERPMVSSATFLVDEPAPPKGRPNG